ncbi:hypothetical protein HN51_012728, partial [Arachis hypogaea]
AHIPSLPSISSSSFLTHSLTSVQSPDCSCRVASWSFKAHSLTLARAANDSAVEAQSRGLPPASVAKLCSTVTSAIYVPSISAAPHIAKDLLCSMLLAVVTGFRASIQDGMMVLWTCGQYGCWWGSGRNAKQFSLLKKLELENLKLEPRSKSLLCWKASRATHQK